MPLVHHELCFGCGRTNVFGLLLELEPTGERSVAGRCFIKQDHQGAAGHTAHEGIIAAALSEAMALACGPTARATAVELRLTAAVAVGSFLAVEAQVESVSGESLQAAARATAESEIVAHARGAYVR